MTLEFEKAWSDLNVRLTELEQGSGLTSALLALETYHRESGFIQDSLQEVERYAFQNPKNPAQFFRVQYNPRRARRFVGSGRGNGNGTALNNGCLLCRENIEWQHQGAQLGYQIGTRNRTYFALTNPFPLFPVHIVVASADHRTQEWKFQDAGGQGADVLIDDLVSLADRMPGHLGFYNGVNAGASNPSHLHFHFVGRPKDETKFPLEMAAPTVAGQVDGPGFLRDYPLEAAFWKGRAQDVVGRATDWVLRWGERNRDRLHGLNANFIASRDHDDYDVALFFVPRDRRKSRSEGFSVPIGGLEVLGEIVFSNAEGKARLSAGEIDYFALEAMLSSVNTPIQTD